MDAVQSKLKEMFGNYQPPNLARMFEWQEKYPDFVRFEIIGSEVYFSYVLEKLQCLEPALSNAERGFKHLKPWTVKCVQNCRNREYTWKKWKFVPAKTVKKISKRPVEEDDSEFLLAPSVRMKFSENLDNLLSVQIDFI